MAVRVLAGVYGRGRDAVAEAVSELPSVGSTDFLATGSGSGGGDARHNVFSRGGRLRGVGAVVSRLSAVRHP
jgi:hypothetical protein